jgi:hypothetical protein
MTVPQWCIDNPQESYLALQHFGTQITRSAPPMIEHQHFMVVGVDLQIGALQHHPLDH